MAFSVLLCFVLVVPGAGIEPARCFQRGILSPVRLPIPPSRQRDPHYGRFARFRQLFRSHCLARVSAAP